MKAREKDLEKFVGKTLSDGESKAAFRCVGYNLITGQLIIDAGEYGWCGLDINDVIDKECDSRCELLP